MGLPERRARLLRRLLQLPVGVVLVAASVLKAADPADFAYQISSYEILPQGLGEATAIAFIIAEFAVGAALLLDALPRFALPGAAALLVGFTAVVAYAWSQGRVQQCGCFGNSIQRTPGETIVEDLVLLALTAGAFLLLRAGPPARPRPALAFAALAGGIVLAVALPRLPVDDLFTALRPGAEVGLDPELLEDDLSQGDRLIAIWQVACDACLRDLTQLERLATEPDGPRVVALFPDGNDAVMTFFLENGPSFDVASMPRGALKPYYRKLPVYFLVRDGRVLTVWRDAAPDPATVRRALGRDS